MSTLFGNFSGVYVIAEVGINHNGDRQVAKDLIRAAAESGANGVKIQVRDLDSVYTRAVMADPLKAEQGTQYLLEELRRAHLSYDDVIELKSFAKQFDVDFFATPFDQKSARFLQEIDMPLFKIGSPDFVNLPLLRQVCGFGKPVILSTGMSTEEEIAEVLGHLRAWKADFSLLHCNSTYPAAYEDINLRYIPVLKALAAVRVGYSGHEQGYAPTLAAVGLGAEIVERHITFDRAQKGPDHSSSLLVAEFAQMVEDIRKVELALGKPRRSYSQGERNNRLSLGKSIVAARDLKAGTVLQASDLEAKTPAKGISPLLADRLIGKTLLQDARVDQYLFQEDVSDSANPRSAEAPRYQIGKRWGVVGRLNDFKEFLELKPNLVEIHMTWRDLVNYERPEGAFAQDLVVHAPEYYKDKLIDFTSPDPEVTEYSLEMLKRTIDVARDLNGSFKGQQDSRGPRVVVHPGGHFSKMQESDRVDQYRRLVKNLKGIDSSGVRILVENMPPFPWYFGGQWYNTIFMNPKEIAEFAAEMKWGICYDTSHAQLYCNSAGLPLKDFTKTVLDHIAYLHVSDAKGTTEEGLQVGRGDIDFEQLFAMLGKIDVGFIPEIWQGHLNRGQGFKEALSYLEKVVDKYSSGSCSH